MVLDASAGKGVNGKEQIVGKYRCFSPYKDKDGVLRVSIRLQEYTLFTEDKMPNCILA